MHVFVPSMRFQGTGERAFFGLGAEKMESVYAWEELNDHINELGDQGWELVNAEPHWIWSTQTVGAPLWAVFADSRRRRVEAATSYPEYIVGWYCTFRREEADPWPSRKTAVLGAVRQGIWERAEMLRAGLPPEERARVAAADRNRPTAGQPNAGPDVALKVGLAYFACDVTVLWGGAGRPDATIRVASLPPGTVVEVLELLSDIFVRVRTEQGLVGFVHPKMLSPLGEPE